MSAAIGQCLCTTAGNTFAAGLTRLTASQPKGQRPLRAAILTRIILGISDCTRIQHDKMKKKPRTLRNRRPKQIDLRPLLNSMREAAKAMSLVTDTWRGAGAAGGQGADDFLRGNFFVGIATGPNELVMSAVAVDEVAKD